MSNHMNTNRVTAATVSLVLALGTAARAELRHVEIQTLGMD
jgi:hypothetical protein